MKLSDFCIKRPVFATVINLLIMLAGIMTFKMLTVREFPNVSVPVVNVETYYEGANATIVESQITQKLEESLSGIEGVDYMSSNTVDEKSQITLRFKPSRNIDDASNDVRDRLSRAKKALPQEADDSVVSKVEADADPIIWLALSSSRHNLMEISDYADRFVKDKIEVISGVARVYVVGERRYSMRIWLDNERLSAYGVTVGDIADALQRQNVEIPSGRIESKDREFTVLAKMELVKPSEFKDIIVKQSKSYLVKLGEVAKVEVGPRDDRFLARYNGNSTLGLGVIKQSTANPLDIANDLNTVMKQVTKNLPSGMKIELAYDSTENIRESIKSVSSTLLEAIGLVILVIFLFLRSVRATIIPIVTIPLALVGTFTIMYINHFSINTLTLLAMVLAIGLVVDDAIVVLENIYRHIEKGEKPLTAALNGMREISSAVIAMTITLAAVFLPLAFTEGRIGKLFTEFAVVLAGSVLISGFTALTLTPMMCGRILKHDTQEHGKFYNSIENALNYITQAYTKGLNIALNNTRVVLIGIGVALGLNILLFSSLPSELAPKEDRGFAIAIGIAPEGSTKEYTDKYAFRIKPMIEKIPEINRYFYIVGYPNVTRSIAFLGLKSWDDRKRSQDEIVQQLSGQLFGIPGILSFAVSPPSTLEEGGFGGPVSFVVQLSGSHEELVAISDKFMAKVRANPKLVNVDSTLKIKKPQILVKVKRDKAASSGVSVDTIGKTLNILLGGQQITYFQQNGKQYDVVLRGIETQRFNPSDILNIRVKTKNNEMVALSNFVEVTENVTPASLNHFNKLRSFTLSASLAPDYSLGEALQYLEKSLDEVNTDGSANYDFDGASRNYMQSTGTLLFVFFVALLVIYLVLAAQFESVIDPFVILLTVPLGVLGALSLMKLFGASLNVFSQIGLVTLIGLITKHGVLIVQFANQLYYTNKNALESVKQAALVRFRPILMTTGATVLGALPLALASGAGSEARQQIGLVIVGGMIFGTVLTLFVVPVVYSLLARFKYRDIYEQSALENMG
jgi:multidrug efflux pump